MRNIFIQECECAIFTLGDGQKIYVYRGDLDPTNQQPFLSIRPENDEDGLLIRPIPCSIAGINVSTEKTGFKKKEK